MEATDNYTVLKAKSVEHEDRLNKQRADRIREDNRLEARINTLRQELHDVNHKYSKLMERVGYNDTLDTTSLHDRVAAVEKDLGETNRRTARISNGWKAEDEEAIRAGMEQFFSSTKRDPLILSIPRCDDPAERDCEKWDRETTQEFTSKWDATKRVVDARLGEWCRSKETQGWKPLRDAMAEMLDLMESYL